MTPGPPGRKRRLGPDRQIDVSCCFCLESLASWAQSEIIPTEEQSAGLVQRGIRVQVQGIER